MMRMMLGIVPLYFNEANHKKLVFLSIVILGVSKIVINLFQVKITEFISIN